MRYTTTTEESAEVLRLALPRIARHGGAYVPTTYTVWFEYLAGLNGALATALDARLQSADRLTQADIDVFYERHIQAREAQSVAQLQRGLHELLDRLGTIAASSSDGLVEFARSASACREPLDALQDPADFGKLVDVLLQSTTAALGSAEALKQEVATTRGEAAQLREQLGLLASEAYLDPLTQLRNRRGLQVAAEELERAVPGTLAGSSVVLADIDHFARINDYFGHLVGDQVLRTAAGIIGRCIKGRDLAARWGSEEFVVLLPGTASDGALALAEQLRLALCRARIRRSDRQEIAHIVTWSLGVAAVGPRDSLEAAIHRADRALRVAKAEGRDCVRLASFIAGD